MKLLFLFHVFLKRFSPFSENYETLIHFRKNLNHFRKMILAISEPCNSGCLFAKAGARTILTIRSKHSWNLEYVINLFQKTSNHNSWKSWICDQYLSKAWKGHLATSIQTIQTMEGYCYFQLQELKHILGRNLNIWNYCFYFMFLIDIDRYW